MILSQATVKLLDHNCCYWCSWLIFGANKTVFVSVKIVRFLSLFGSCAKKEDFGANKTVFVTVKIVRFLTYLIQFGLQINCKLKKFALIREQLIVLTIVRRIADDSNHTVIDSCIFQPYPWQFCTKIWNHRLQFCIEVRRNPVVLLVASAFADHIGSSLQRQTTHRTQPGKWHFPSTKPVYACQKLCCLTDKKIFKLIDRELKEPACYKCKVVF